MRNQQKVKKEAMVEQKKARDHMNVLIKFDVRIALPGPEIIGVPKKFGQSLDTPHAPFSPKF